jgi:hypothetical protein
MTMNCKRKCAAFDSRKLGARDNMKAKERGITLVAVAAAGLKGTTSKIRI